MRKILIELLGEKYNHINQVRDANGQAWYKAKDICKALGIKNTCLAVNGNIRIGYFGIEKSDIYRLDSIKTSPLYISETGMFKLILKSRKQAAYLIKVHLSKNVLPAIMQDGSFTEKLADSYPGHESTDFESTDEERCACSC